MKRLLIGTALACLVLPALAQGLPKVPVYHTDEGKPIDVRDPEKKGDLPLFPEQTRAPYHKTAPFNVTVLTGALHAPWGMAFLPDGGILVTERLPGAFRILSKDGKLSAPLAGLTGLADTPETGLLDVVTDPKFANNHRIFFTFFSYDDMTVGNTAIASARLDGETLSNVKILLRTSPLLPNDQTLSAGTKSGGRIAIGKDGYLYVTIGDRDNAGTKPWGVAQLLDTHLGKVIRITTDGKPAPGNPFLGKPGSLPEIWAYGLRSPEGLAFNPADGKLYEVEHGPRGGDEFNNIEKAKNYGWPIISHGIDYGGKMIGDGSSAKPGMEQPVYYWSPSTAPSGLAFYQGSLFPEWKNSVFVGMLNGRLLDRFTFLNGKAVTEEPLLTGMHERFRDVRVGPDGAVYVLTDSGGTAISDDTPATAKLLKLTPK
jgi:aldose sugar dehydrogenase